jgi:ABC-2 type transport system ATP-binding protein
MIEMSNLRKEFGPLVAVRDLSLHVPAGEIFCFLGPNGAGKTTTIKILTGLMRPTSGAARICGIDVIAQPVEAKKKMGYIPDMPYLYERLTAREFFEFAGDLYNIPRERVREELKRSFDLFDLEEQRDMLIKELSHGMRQRLIYCATFLHEPSVLFVDEPLTGLDPFTIRLLKELLVRKARAGMTVFLTTHILALAEDIADRIGIILKGQVEALGTVGELAASTGCANLEDAFLKITAKHERRSGRLGAGAE